MTQEQIARLQSLAEYTWFVDGDTETVILRKLSSLMDEIETEEELLYAGCIKEWDAEDGSIMMLFDHPLCDYGLALRFYWMFQPDFFHRQKEKGREFKYSEIPTWDIIQKIEKRLLSEFYKERKIKTDPAEIHGRPLSDNDKYSPGIRLIPHKLKEISDGVDLEFNPKKIWSEQVPSRNPDKPGS